MVRICIYVAIVIGLVSCTWTSEVTDNGKWPWMHTKYLTKSNWTTALKANQESSKVHHSVWFIFHYLHYCGFCKKAEPGWEAIAEYGAGTSE